MNNIKDIFFALIHEIKIRGIKGVGKVKFVKLLYLLEWLYVQQNNTRLTELNWKFWHYGPYPVDFENELRESGIDPPQFMINEDKDFYDFSRLNVEEYHLDHNIIKLVSYVVNKWAAIDTNQLLDYVYFRTDPMFNAQRGNNINLFDYHPELHYEKPQPLSITNHNKYKAKEMINRMVSNSEIDKIDGPPPIIDKYLIEILNQMDLNNDL